ncbi:Di-copper centre-containing protein [Periconia macrospinosa]|uniref:Di-copper centre-containing protein n=1 Tax=Periconia macrospinosa TaxID=97972 RepID=A0A2V1DF35_9PLEO|nr:Di-copper centre-containing protein [Periconia macrospinosa]
MGSFKLVHALLVAASVRLAVAQNHSSCTEIRARVPWTNLTSDEKTAYINADLCLINAPAKSGLEGAVTRWDDIQWPHIVQSATVHNVGAFLPFHRYYLTAHEHLIRTECGYTGRMPYWDEFAAIGRMYDTDMFDDQYFGGNGTDDGTYRVIDGQFANLTLRWIGDGSVKDHKLTRMNDEGALNKTDQKNIDKCNAITNYTSAWECWSSGPHGAGHEAIGGIMVDGTLSPGDPLFYLHHSYLDKLWWEWQKLDLPNRLLDVGGPNLPIAGTQPGGPSGNNGTAVPSAPGVPENPTKHLGGNGPEFTDYFGDNGGNVTTLNHNIYMTNILPNVTIGQLMDLNSPVICSEYY